MDETIEQLKARIAELEARSATPVAWECSSPEGEKPTLAFLTSKPPTVANYIAQGWRVLPLYAVPVASIAMAKDIRREALEEAAQMVERGGHESLELGFERFGRYSKEVAANIRDLATSEPKNMGN